MTTISTANSKNPPCSKAGSRHSFRAAILRLFEYFTWGFLYFCVLVLSVSSNFSRLFDIRWMRWCWLPLWSFDWQSFGRSIFRVQTACFPRLRWVLNLSMLLAILIISSFILYCSMKLSCSFLCQTMNLKTVILLFWQFECLLCCFGFWW